jgi:hypothetical protein
MHTLLIVGVGFYSLLSVVCGHEHDWIDIFVVLRQTSDFAQFLVL